MAKSRYINRVGNMVVNPYVEGDIMDYYPILKECLPQNPNEYLLWDKYLRYCVFILDPQSPLVKEYPDLKARKEIASQETGWDVSRGDLQTELNLLKNVYQSRLWTLITTIEATFDEFTAKVKNPIEGESDEDILKAVEKKGKMLMQMEDMVSKLDTLKQKFYGGDERLEEVDNKPKTVEQMANMGKKK